MQCTFVIMQRLPIKPCMNAQHGVVEALLRVPWQGEATVPSLFGEELDTNPFLRPSDSGIRASVKADSSIPDHEVFGRVRAAKDGFRG